MDTRLQFIVRQSFLLILASGCGNTLVKQAGENSDDAIRDIFSPITDVVNGNTNNQELPEQPHPATDVPKFSLSVERYASCDALQADIRTRLAARREDERRYQVYQEAMADYWRGSGSSKKASARKANSRGATGHLIGISVICMTRRPPCQVARASRNATAPSNVKKSKTLLRQVAGSSMPGV